MKVHNVMGWKVRRKVRPIFGPVDAKRLQSVGGSMPRRSEFSLYLFSSDPPFNPAHEGVCRLESNDRGIFCSSLAHEHGRVYSTPPQSGMKAMGSARRTSSYIVGAEMNHF